MLLSFTESAWPNIFVTSTAGLTVQGNRLTPVDPQDFTAPRCWKWRSGTSQPEVTVIELCDEPKQ